MFLYNLSYLFALKLFCTKISIPLQSFFQLPFPAATTMPDGHAVQEWLLLPLLKVFLGHISHSVFAVNLYPPLHSFMK